MTPHEMYGNLFIATLSRLAARDLTPLTENREHAIHQLADLASDVAQGGVDLHVEAMKKAQANESDCDDSGCTCDSGCDEPLDEEGEFYTDEEVFDKVVDRMSKEELAKAAAKLLKKVSRESNGAVRVRIIQCEE